MGGTLREGKKKGIDIEYNHHIKMRPMTARTFAAECGRQACREVTVSSVIDPRPEIGTGAS